ncbi:MAG: hypothetical protein LBN43_00625, partial [Oscillospiraceae bacterium]|nr:hypothetical protein [Oscillospiraceae bacterium]
ESVNITDAPPSIAEPPEVLSKFISDDNDDNRSPDYEAIVEAMELKLESLDTEIKERQAEYEQIADAAQLKADAVMADAENEAEQIKSEARELGYNEGRAAAELELQELRNGDTNLVNRALQEIGEAKIQVLANQEDEIVTFCFDIVKKIFGTDFERGQEALIKQALKELGADESAFTPVDTIFDYEGQTIDASFETQLRKIRNEFTKVP